jgi:lipid A 3-O-deacylase
MDFKLARIWVSTIFSGFLVLTPSAGLSDDGKNTLDGKATVAEPDTAQLQMPPSSPGRITAIEENPTFSPNGKDRHYTNGAKLAYTTSQLSNTSIWSRPIQFFSGSLFNRPTAFTDNRLEWTILSQSIFTPEDHHRPGGPDPNDRPFAAWLHGGFTFIQNTDDRQLTSLDAQFGVVGPWALGRQIQSATHSVFGEQQVRGWSHQIHNEPGITISWDRRWRFNHELGNSYSWELIPEVGATVGNVLTYANIGALARFGKGLKASWGPDTIQPGIGGTSYFSAERGGTNWGYDVYAGVEGRAVALNIFLDGNNFRDSRSVAKTPGVADGSVGLEFFYRDLLRIGFTFSVRTNEFYRQRGIDQFGGFNLSVGF